MRRPVALALVLAALLPACGYVLAARPDLPGGLTRVTVPVFENDTPEAGVGALVASRLADRAQADDRFGTSPAGGRVLGRVEALDAAPAAFPVDVSGPGAYRLGLRVRLRLVDAAGETLREALVSATEPYLAGAGPEQTEANRRRALERLAGRLADEGWQRLTLP